jgi:hypothetical protein
MRIEEQPQGKRFGRLKNGGIPCDITNLPRCQAKAKSTGKRCGNIACKGKNVCYIHGGKSPGAKRGNSYALKHGMYTAEAIAERKVIGELIKVSRDGMADL